VPRTCRLGADCPVSGALLTFSIGWLKAEFDPIRTSAVLVNG
jgi:hypothetical protein